jgi:hypothetical protein
MKNVANQQTHLSRFFLERVLCDELDLEQYPDHKSHVQGCTHCTDYLAKAHEQAAQLVEAYPSFERLHAAYGASVRSTWGKADALTPVWRWLDAVWLKPALAAVMVCLVVVGVLLMPRTTAPVLTAKGDVSFSLYVNGAPAARDGDAIACLPGDTLQLLVSSPEPVYCWVLYRDDDAEVKIYMPTEDERIGPIGSIGGVRLPHAIVLDSAWGEEELFCVWSAQPRSHSQVVKYVNRVAADPDQIRADGEFRMQTFSLRSGSR